MKRLLALFFCTVGITSLFGQDPYSIQLNEVLANGTVLKNTNGHGIDRVELYNPTGVPIDIAGCTLTDSTGGGPTPLPPKYTFPAPSVVPALGYLVVNLDPDNTNGNNFGISAKSDTIYFRSTIGADIDTITFGIQVADLTIGRVPDGALNWTLTSPTLGTANSEVELDDPSFLKINEWYAAGNNDFVELYNQGTKPVPLTGVRLADSGIHDADPTPSHWPAIPPLSFVGVGKQKGFVAFYEDTQGLNGLPLPFGLSKNGESIYLAKEDGTPIDQIINFGLQDKDASEGRLPDGSDNLAFFVKRRTPGAPNRAQITAVWVNELLTHTDLPLEDAVEFYNQTDTAVDMTGWYMSDDLENPTRFKFPTNSVVPAHGYFVLYEYQFRNNSTPPDYTFNSAHGGTVYITQPDTEGNLIADMETPFRAAQNGVSFGRITTSDNDTDLVPLTCRSFGNDNHLPPGTRGVTLFRQGTGLPNDCGILWGPVILNEIMYHPLDLGLLDNVAEEYIELRNVTSADVPLYDPKAPTNHWKILGGVQYEFATGDVIPRGGYMLVVSFDPNSPGNAGALAAFTNKYNLGSIATRPGKLKPGQIPVRGPYIGALGNADAVVELWRTDPPQKPPHPDAGYVPQIMVDRLHYYDSAPWPDVLTGVDGGGNSLHRALDKSYGDEPTAWRSAAPTPGRANQQYLTLLAQPISQTVLYSNQATFNVVVGGEAPHYQWLFKNKPMKGARTNDTLIIQSVSRKDAGIYTLVATNLSSKVVSSNVTLTAVQPVVIRTQPKGLTVKTGGRAILHSKATGSAPLHYQWWLNGNPIDGATNLTYTIASASQADAGVYTVVVDNGPSQATSLPATVTVTP